MRIGQGYDVHRLVGGRPLVLGGVRIPFAKGLDGHSDADVLVHAACDALLGAAGAGDIGRHFPDSDPRYRNIYSIRLLESTVAVLRDKGFSVVNLDAVVLAEAPKLQPYRKEMQNSMARAMGLDPGRVNIKATTTEGLGPIGRGEGIAALCIALLSKKMDEDQS
ncbi:MAG: 2-C-methyl-D-erythritol 2,4-cyclodiphosphate synthase [Desulfobacterales bacterium]